MSKFGSEVQPVQYNFVLASYTLQVYTKVFYQCSIKSRCTVYEASGCYQCMGPVGVMTGDGQLVVDFLDYHLMNYPSRLLSVLFGSIIPTFCSIFSIVIFLVLLSV